MNSISQTTKQMDAVSKKTSCFFHRYHVGQILRSANACKLKGFSAILVFLVLVSIIFENRSLYRQRRLHEESLPFGKDTAYRFLNSCHTNWRKFTLLLAARIINATIKPLTDASRRCAIVVDDSLFSRSRSKRVELLANVYDHVSHRYTKGFRLLVLGWTDGNTFLPLTFCLLSTSKGKNRLNEADASVDTRSNGGKFSNVKTIYKEHRKRRGRSRYLLSVDAVATKQGELLVPVRLVFVRNRNNRKDYLVLVTTDLSLSEEEVIQLYGKRWGIEVFFKTCKSYLRLGKDCRSISYDAMTAHVAIVCTRYMLLAVEERENTDGRSIGELFYLGLDELPDLKYMEALHLVMQEFAEQLRAEYPSEILLVESLLERFMSDLPALWMSHLNGQRCA